MKLRDVLEILQVSLKNAKEELEKAPENKRNALYGRTRAYGHVVLLLEEAIKLERDIGRPLGGDLKLAKLMQTAADNARICSNHASTEMEREEAQGKLTAYKHMRTVLAACGMVPRR